MNVATSRSAHLGPSPLAAALPSIHSHQQGVAWPESKVLGVSRILTQTQNNGKMDSHASIQHNENVVGQGMSQIREHNVC